MRRARISIDADYDKPVEITRGGDDHGPVITGTLKCPALDVDLRFRTTDQCDALIRLGAQAHAALVKARAELKGPGGCPCGCDDHVACERCCPYREYGPTSPEPARQGTHYFGSTLVRRPPRGIGNDTGEF